MAKEIKSIERQVATPAVNIKPNTAFATLGEATSELGTLIGNVLQDQAVYHSGLAGQEDAISGKTPKTLAPPVTKATAAYNKAVIETEARQLTTQGREMMLQTYAELSNPATFNTQTPAEFNARITGIMQGIVDNTRKENRVAVQQQLDEVAASVKLKMLDNAIQYDNKQTEMSFKFELDRAQEQLREALFSKNPELIKMAQSNLGNILSDYAQINQGIADQLPTLTKAIMEQAKVDEVASDFMQSYNNGTEVQYLDKLTKQKPDNLTHEEYFKALQTVLKIENSLQSAEQRYNQEQYAKAHYEIVSGRITTLEQLQAEYGNNVPAASFYALSETLIAKNKTEDAVYEVERARYYGANEVAKLPNKILNDYYKEKEKRLLAEINANMPADGVPLQRLNLAQRAEFIVLPAGAPIPDFLIDMSYAMKSSNPDVSMDAMNAYRVLFTNQGAFGDTLKGLDSDADDIAQYTLSVGDVSEADTFDLIKTAQSNINDKSDATMVARRDRLKKLYAVKDGVNLLQTTYKKSYGVLPDNPNTDAHYGTFQKLFDNYFMGVANGSETVALSMTQNALRDWGKSRFGEKNNMMYAPPDLAIPFAEVGYWMDNQVGEALNGLLTKHEEMQTGVARPKWMADLPISDATTDQQLMDENYYPKRTALVNGIEREIFIQSTKNTRTSEFAGEVYQFYYLDDYGVKQYLADPNNPLGIASWLAMGMDEFVPTVFSNMKDESFDEMALRIYEQENIGKTDDSEKSPAYTPYFIDAEDYEAGRRLLLKKGKLNNEDLELIKQRLRNAGKKKIVFKNGKPVEEAEQIAQDIQASSPPPVAPTDELNRIEVNLEDIGRRKKK